MHAHLPGFTARLAAGLAALVVLCTASQARAKDLPLARFAPYTHKGALKQAGEALAAGRFSRARQALVKHLRRRRPRYAKQARFLLAYANMRLRRNGEATAGFRALVPRYRLLADYCRYYAARSSYKAKRFAEALGLARGVSATATLTVDASLLQADALRALGRLPEALPLWRSYLRRRPGGARAAEGHLRLAQAALKAAGAASRPRVGGSAKLDEASSHFKAVIVRHPLSRHASKARKGLKELAAMLPKGKSASTLTGKELYRQARVFYRKQRNRRAERGFAAAIARGLDLKGRCQARYYQAKSIFKQRQRDRAEPHFAKAAKLCQRAKLSELVVKSLYNQARGLYRKGKFVAAARLFLSLERRFPKHSYGDDARLRAAEAYAELKKKKKVRQILAKLPALHPRGDQRREALWRLAWQAYLDKRWKGALAHLQRIVDTLGTARKYYAEGRALYWKARILARLGKPKAAVKSYEAAIRTYPLSYYALLGFNRLRERWPRRYRKLRDELLRPIGKKAGRWRFADHGRTAKEGFRRGVELLRLGFGDHAARELARAGLSTRRGPKRELWLAAVLFDRAGQWVFSHQVPRSRDWRWKRAYPLADNVRRWRIAYPKAFPRLVMPLSKRAGVPRELTWAVMREESGFSTRIESYANAIGLMQLILPTARAAASYHRQRVDRRALQRPATNIRLGTTFLAFLRRAFDKVPPLVIAGYNAGHGAVYRWLRNYRGNTLDELSERIPYDQTRRYSKRVLASFFAYTVLWGRKDVPRIGLKLPKVKRQRFRRR